jgi:hypothetical protein
MRSACNREFPRTHQLAWKPHLRMAPQKVYSFHDASGDRLVLHLGCPRRPRSTLLLRFPETTSVIVKAPDRSRESSVGLRLSRTLRYDVITAVQPYALLSALPALLALAGFVLYQVLGANKAGDEISRRILDKLRASLHLISA